MIYMHGFITDSGHVIISGCAEGVVAISNPATGLVIRVISDHQGAPVTDLQASSNSLMVRTHLHELYVYISLLFIVD